jgi:hypothetical protein
MKAISDSAWFKSQAPKSFQSMTTLPLLFAPSASAGNMRMKSLRPDKAAKEVVADPGVKVSAGTWDERQVRLLLRKAPPKNALVKKKSAMTASFTSMGAFGLRPDGR